MVMKKGQYWGEFCNVFGVSPRNRILEFFLEMRTLDFGIGDVSKETKLNRATTYYIINALVKERIIIPSRKLGKTQLYKLNIERPEVKALIAAFNSVLITIATKHEPKIAMDRDVLTVTQ